MGAAGETGDHLADLAARWIRFAEANLKGYSPLYERIVLAVAADREVLEMVRAAPPSAHDPLVLLAAVHYLLLAGFHHPLADVYAGRSDADPGPLFLEVCRARHDDLVTLLATRHTQTNECGRSAVIGPGLTWLASRLDSALALIDVGASAGLNLIGHRYRLDYGVAGATGPADSPVRVACEVIAGDPPIAARLPPFVSRVGIDRSPVVLNDPDATRWLLACVWPDTGRLERTAAAIEVARREPPTVVAGRAGDVLPTQLAGLAHGVAAVVMTTWAFAYFPIGDRERFVDLLAAESRRRPIAWLSAESQRVVAGLQDLAAAQPAARRAAANANVLGAAIFDGGAVERHLLGYVHPHGIWIDWREAG